MVSATLMVDSQEAKATTKVSDKALELAFPDGEKRELRNPLPGFDSIDSALRELAEGNFVVVLDNEDRENEGDLVMAADKVTPERIAFMVNHTSGLICVSMPKARTDALGLPLMVESQANVEAMKTAFTVTVDAREGVTTGISAADRSRTIQLLADPATQASDLSKPGHILPLVAREEGVLLRPGHTEAAVDMARLAGCQPAGVLCEIVNKDGSMARKAELLRFAREHDLSIVTIADLVRYRIYHEQQ